MILDLKPILTLILIIFFTIFFKINKYIVLLLYFNFNKGFKAFFKIAAYN